MTRRPFYWTSRRAWYVKQPRGNGRVRTIRLSDDESEARAIWEAHFKPRRPVIPVRPEEKTSPDPQPGWLATPARSQRRENRPPSVSDSRPQPRPEPATRRQQQRCPKRNQAESSDRYYRQLGRVLLICELLAPLRRGASLAELVADVQEMSGDDFCERTIRRDLDFLERIGLVERVAAGDGDKASVRWRWRGGSVRATVAEQLASQVSAISA